MNTVLFVAMTFLGSLGAYFFKLMNNKQYVGLSIISRELVIGVFFYIISLAINIYLLGKYQLSIVLPITSLTYVWTLVLSAVFLKEKITKWNILGVTFIVLGVAIIVM